ncbi:uncharacterized protein ACDL77_023106 [Rhynchocyon petersi]
MADKILKEKRKLFVQALNKGAINGLLDELLEKRVLNQGEMETIRDENVTAMDKARALLDSIIKKGCRACEICIQHLCEEDPFLADTLGLSLASLTMQDTSAKKSASGPGGILKFCSIEEAKLMQKNKASEIYPIREKTNRTRLALIICNTEFESLSKRTGAEADINGMELLLQGLGYKVIVKQGLTASDMTAELKAFAVRPEHERSDSTFVVFMSHGIRDGICGKNHSEKTRDILDVNTIFQMLNTRNCPKLQDKPKVIIIQACRGESRGDVWLKDSATISANSSSEDIDGYEDDAIRRSHVEKDFIAFYSSTPENVSWRHPTYGSCFISRLIEYLQEHAANCHLQAIFQKVQRSFEMPDDKVLMEKRKLFIQSMTKASINGLLDELLEKKVLRQEEMEIVRNEKCAAMENARVLIDSLIRKGPQACQICINYLRQEDPFVAEKLGLSTEKKRNEKPIKIAENLSKEFLNRLANNVVANNSVKLNDKEKQEIYNAQGHKKIDILWRTFNQKPEVVGQFVKAFRNNEGHIEAPPEVNPRSEESDEFPETLNLCPREQFLRLSNEKAGQIYPIKERNNRTRQALIICNIEFMSLDMRHGAEVDITRMEQLLESLDYKVKVEKNLTAMAMQSVLQTFARLPEHETSDSTFLVFMSHGILEGICGTGHSKEQTDVLSYHTIFQIFNNLNCESLKDKPKIIIVQACRGDNESMRHETEGSPFITNLIKCVQKYSWCYHIEEIFRKVQQLFEVPEVYAQMPTMERVSMSRYFYLFPGN